MMQYVQTATRALTLAFVAGLLILGGDAQAQSGRTPDLQAGDRLTIVIPERGEADALEVTIDEYGEISLGVYGRVAIGGMSQTEALRALSNHLRSYLRSTTGLRINVEERGALVFVTGQVRNPGRYTVPRGSDVWVAVRTAGGELETADISRVVVQRGTEEVVVDVAAYLTRRSTEPLPELQPGDLVFVPADPTLGVSSAGAGRVLDDAALADKIFVLGGVEAPGLFDRTQGLTALGALGLAGGPSELSDLRTARLITSEGSVLLDLAELMTSDAPLPPLPDRGGVILYVPFAQDGRVNPFTNGISVIGEFNTPNQVETNTPVPLFEVMALAGGPATEADIRRVYHVRQGEGFSIALEYDMRRFVRHGGPLGTVDVHPGDVLYLRPDPDNAWEILVGGMSDVAVISSAVLLFVTLNNSL